MYYDEDLDYEYGIEPNVTTKKPKWKWITAGIVMLLLVAAVTVLAVTLAKVPVGTLTATEYRIGTLSVNGNFEESKNAVVTKDFVNAENFSVKLTKEAKVTYKIAFYDADKDFIEMTEELSENYNPTSLPEGAMYFKLTVIPTETKDLKTSDIKDIVTQLTVIYGK